MSVSVDYLEYEDLLFDTDDISFGEVESIEVPVNGGASGDITTIPLRKRQVTLTARGATEDDVRRLEALRGDNVTALLAKQDVGIDLDFGGFPIPKAYLADVTPGGFRKVNGKVVYDSIELLVNAQRYT